MRHLDSFPRATPLFVAALLAALVSPGCTPTTPPAPTSPTTPAFSTAERFLVHGNGTATIKGLDVAASFELELLVDGTSLAIQRFAVEVRDFDIVRHFLFIETAREKFRCTRATNESPMLGTVDAAGSIRVPAGAKMYGETYENRAPERDAPCTGRVALFNGTSDRDVSGVHNPRGDHFALSGSFHTTYEGDGLPMSFNLTGRYRNRPPVALIGVEGPGYNLAQGGCPPLSGVNPPAAEANDPAGLRLTLVSNAYDPDSRDRTQLVREDWVHWLGDPADPGSPYSFLGAGRRVGPVLFEFSPQEHFIRLTARDNWRAEARSGCRFRVADTTPPVVTPPAAVTIPCLDPAGVTPADSLELAEFLANVSVLDLVDPQPEEMPPLLEGVEIADNTLFKPGPHLVTFRFQDRFGNLAEQGANLEVGESGDCG